MMLEGFRRIRAVKLNYYTVLLLGNNEDLRMNLEIEQMQEKFKEVVKMAVQMCGRARVGGGEKWNSGQWNNKVAKKVEKKREACLLTLKTTNKQGLESRIMTQKNAKKEGKSLFAQRKRHK